MKRILTVGLLAVGAALCTSRPADAWTNCKFSIGLNWSCQSGNNNLFWGLWHNGQVPEYDGIAPGGHGPGVNPLPPGWGPPYAPGTQPFPYFGNNQQQQKMQSMPTASSYTNGYHQTNYQPSYQTPSSTASYTPGYYYYTPSYYTPSYYPGYGDGFSWFGQ